MPFFLRLVLIGLGTLAVVNPRLAWYLSDGWKFRDAEPSDAALVMARIGGVVTVLIGLFMR